MQSYTVEFV